MATLEPANTPENILPEIIAQIEDNVSRTFYNSSRLPPDVIEYTYATMGWDDQLRITVSSPNARNFYIKRIHLVIIKATNGNVQTWNALANRLDRDEIGYKITYRKSWNIYRPTWVCHNGITQPTTSYRLMKSFVRERRYDIKKALEQVTERSNKRAWDNLKAMEKTINTAGATLEAKRLTLHP